MAKAEKEVKNKSKDEIIIDMLNFHISNGNLTEDKVKSAHKNKVK